MSTLQLLLVNHAVQTEPDDAFAQDGVIVLPATGLDEASEAIYIQRFDAVLLRPPVAEPGLKEFTQSLRQLEEAQNGGRTPVLILSDGVPDGEQWVPAEEGGGSIDGFLSDRFKTEGLRQALLDLSASLAARAGGPGSPAQGLPVFDVEGYRTQMDDEKELMVEIIDLFLVEGEAQMSDMDAAVVDEDFERLSRGAHTIKGSFSSLHAPAARAIALQLEQCAGTPSATGCFENFANLREAVNELKSELSAFRTKLTGRV